MRAPSVATARLLRHERLESCLERSLDRSGHVRARLQGGTSDLVSGFDARPDSVLGGAEGDICSLTRRRCHGTFLPIGFTFVLPR